MYLEWQAPTLEVGLLTQMVDHQNFWVSPISSHPRVELLETVLDSIYLRVESVSLRQHSIISYFVKVKSNSLKLEIIVPTSPCFMPTSGSSVMVNLSIPSGNQQTMQSNFFRAKGPGFVVAEVDLVSDPSCNAW